MRVVTYYFIFSDFKPDRACMVYQNRVRMKIDQDEINLEAALSQNQ
ncbi:hypothetical protein [Piscirickettsia salmonis]|nr:hypothetical protein [Piscirickettsia salmonis]QIX54091.1 hypothetical protein GW536_08000 [Piscirickettsia salmonis]